MSVFSIIIAILVFGLLIFIHEMGHFLTARMFGVTVKEFAIGMGPKLISRVGKKTGTIYSVRAFPFGGFTSMAGEDEESDDPNAFSAKPLWQRFIITAAGSLANLSVGIILMAALVMFSGTLGSTTIHSFFLEEGQTKAQSESEGLMAGDRIVAVDGERVHIANELAYEIMRRGVEDVDVTVIRDGEEITIKDVTFPKASSDGISFGSLDFFVYSEPRSFSSVITHAFFRCELTIEMIWESLVDLVSGRYGMEAVSGPVGVTQVLGEAAETGFADLVYMAVVLSMNLGIMNLLPLPALDGGRLIFLIVELLRGGKRVNPNAEAIIHFMGIVVLLSLMVLIAFKDIASFF